jgi:RND superfamily putative drug exporter
MPLAGPERRIADASRCPHPAVTASATRRRVAEGGGGWLPAAVLLGWLVLGAVGGWAPGALAEVQRTDGESFLPAAAEVTEVVRLQEELAGGKVQPASVVFGRPEGLTGADADAIAARAGEISRLPGLTGPASAPVPARDGKAVLVTVPVSGVDGFAAGRTVDRMREVVRDGLPPGLSVHVTGPAGYTADFGAVFDGIDGRLLLVTGLVVAVVLVAVHRSPLLPVVVLVSAGLALVVSALVIRPLAAEGAFTLNGQSQGILFILVFGASTDYALLLVARYREEAARADPRRAVVAAVRASAGSIVASAGTVILGLCCLLLSELSSNRGLGPVAAIGIAASLLVSLTFLPAALVVLGGRAFWPLRPHPSARPRLWERVAGFVGRRYPPLWVLCLLTLIGLSVFAGALRSSGVRQSARGWDAVCADLNLVTVPGHHLSLLDPPSVSVIAEHLAGVLRRVRR